VTLGTFVGGIRTRDGGVVASGGFGGSSGQEKARTYAEMLEDRSLLPGDRAQIRAQATLGLAAHLLLQRGEDKVTRLLLDVIRLDVEQVDDQWDPDRLWLEVAPEHMRAFDDSVVGKIRDACDEIDQRRNYQISLAGVREALPDVGPDWQESLRQQLVGGTRPTNHARRVRSEPPRFVEDGLSFTNDGELAVYKMLKEIQASMPGDETIGIFPLAGGRLPGKTWEPDVLVTYRRRVGVLEIDGPQHNARRAMDMSRDSLWLDTGVAYVDRITVEALMNPRELGTFLRKFLKRLAETR
jgi:hypothetical protein